MGNLNYLHRDPNFIRLLWVFVVVHCVDSYHVLGVYTEWAVLTSALQSVAGARDRTFLPRRMTLTGRWTHNCDWPAPTPTTSMKHTPLSLRLSPEPSTPFFDLPSPFKMHLEYFHPHSIPPTSTLVRKPARSCAVCVRGEHEDGNSDASGSADVKHSWHHHSAWVSTHTVLLTLILGQVRSPLCLPWFNNACSMTHWAIGWCVSWRNFVMLIPPVHLLRRDHDTDPVRMSFFHAMAWCSNPIPLTLCAAPEPSILPLLPQRFCLRSSP